MIVIIAATEAYGVEENRIHMRIRTKVGLNDKLLIQKEMKTK